MCLIYSFIAGVEEHNSIFRKETYENTDVFLMCFSIDNQDSLENIETKWWPEVHSVCPKGTRQLY